MALPDPLDIFRSAPDPSAGFDEYFQWLKKNQVKLQALEGREREQAEAFTGLRRGEIADRPGFAGLVKVGEARRRTDVTLAADISRLAEDDPQRIAFEDALTAERELRVKQTRVVSGEQFAAEDAIAALEDRLEDIDIPLFDPRGGALSDLETLLTDFEAFSKKFDWYEDDSLLGDIEALLNMSRGSGKAMITTPLQIYHTSHLPCMLIFLALGISR